jgi:hypothetical protein
MSTPCTVPNSTFVVNLTFTGSGLITLNGLTNGYTSPPSGGDGNPPVVMQYINLTSTGVNGPYTLIQAGGLSGTCSYGNPNYLNFYYYQYNGTFTYNLPDGTLFTVTFSAPNSGEIDTNATTCSISANSLYVISSAVLDGFTYNISIERNGTSS